MPSPTAMTLQVARALALPRLAAPSLRAATQPPQRMTSDETGLPPCALLYLHAFLRSSQVTCLAAPALLFVDVQWEFELPLCGAAIALPFALSLSAFAVSGDITAPFNASTPTLLARAHHAAM